MPIRKVPFFQIRDSLYIESVHCSVFFPVAILEARKLKKMDITGASDPYVKIKLFDSKVRLLFSSPPTQSIHSLPETKLGKQPRSFFTFPFLKKEMPLFSLLPRRANASARRRRRRSSLATWIPTGTSRSSSSSTRWTWRGSSSTSPYGKRRNGNEKKCSVFLFCVHFQVCDYDLIGGGDPIGKIKLGWNQQKTYKPGFKHWKEVLENPRRPIIKWHVLQVNTKTKPSSFFSLQSYDGTEV